MYSEKSTSFFFQWIPSRTPSWISILLSYRQYMYNLGIFCKLKILVLDLVSTEGVSRTLFHHWLNKRVFIVISRTNKQINASAVPFLCNTCRLQIFANVSIIECSWSYICKSIIAWRDLMIRWSLLYTYLVVGKVNMIHELWVVQWLSCKSIAHHRTNWNASWKFFYKSSVERYKNIELFLIVI